MRRGKITRRQHQAGLAFAEICRGSHPHAALSERAAAGKRLDLCLAALTDCHPAGLVKASVDSVCRDGIWPEAATAMGHYALCDGLSALAELFNVPRDRKRGRQR